MIKIKSFEFSRRELAGSMGDLGVLIPFAIGYMSVCGLNPAGFLVMMGLANIATGIAYRLPMPIEPMKVIAIAAIAQHWTPSMIYASGFAMGIIWILFAITGIVGWLGRVTPTSVIRGIQITLGVLLVIEAYKLLATGWFLGIAATILAIILRQNRHAPAAIVLMALGIGIVLVKGEFSQVSPPGFSLPPLTGFHPGELWQTLLLAGFAQIPLTVTNATIATSSLIRTYWPNRHVSERRLSLNQGRHELDSSLFRGHANVSRSRRAGRAVLLWRQNRWDQHNRRTFRDNSGFVPGFFSCRNIYGFPQGYHRGHDAAGWV